MKRIRNGLIVVFILAMTAFLMVACASESNDGTKVTLSLAGQNVDGNGEYSATVQEGDSISYTIVVGTLTDYEFTVASSASATATATATATKLTINGVAAGQAKITLSEKSQKANDLVVNVTVTAAPEEEKIAPTGVVFSNLSEDNTGDGTLDAPYVVAALTENKTSTHTMVIQPSNADAEFDWTVGTKQDEAFTESDSTGLTVTQTNKTLTITSGDQLGTFYVRGAAQTGDYTVYLSVTVEHYAVLTGITANLAASEDENYDYYIKTAKGTTWDMTGGITARGQQLLNGEIFSGYQAPLNLTYYPNIYKITFTAAPEDASNTAWVTQSDDSSVFTINPDGTYTAGAAGETVVTVTNSAGEAEIKIKVEVIDTLYAGVLKSDYDAATADTECYWNFDSNADDWDYTRGMLEQWHLVVNKTTSYVTGDDGNQKIFYLGHSTRVYGIDLESRIDSTTGVSTGSVMAIAWAKATIPTTATTLTTVIAHNSGKTFGSYRILFVADDGVVTDITGWVAKDGADDITGVQANFDIPAAILGKTGALVLETALSQMDDNCEIMVKGIWINYYRAVESVTLSASAAEVGQEGTYTISATVSPSLASNKSLTYTVTSTPEGGDGKVTVSSKGKITVASDAPTGVYTIVVASVDNSEATATFTLTVTGYNNLTSFTATVSLADGTTENLNGATISAKYGTSTTADMAITFSFAPANASVTTYSVSYKDNGATEAGTTSTVALVSGGKIKIVGVGTTTITITPNAEEAANLAITFTVTVTENTVITSWANKTAILDETNGWTISGSYDAGVGEGADINANSDPHGTLTKTITLDGLKTLTIGLRTFVRSGETNGKLYVSVKVNGVETRIYASNYTYAEGEDTILIDTTDSSWDSRNAFNFDLSAYEGQEVEICIGCDQGTHCVVMDIALN